MRCESSTISSRAASTAAARRPLSPSFGAAGRVAVSSGTRPPGWPDVRPRQPNGDREPTSPGRRRKGRFGYHDERDDEERAGKLKQALEPQDHEDRHDDPDPRGT